MCLEVISLRCVVSRLQSSMTPLNKSILCQMLCQFSLFGLNFICKICFYRGFATHCRSKKNPSGNFFRYPQNRYVRIRWCHVRKYLEKHVTLEIKQRKFDARNRARFTCVYIFSVRLRASTKTRQWKSTLTAMFNNNETQPLQYTFELQNLSPTGDFLDPSTVLWLTEINCRQQQKIYL